MPMIIFLAPKKNYLHVHVLLDICEQFSLEFRVKVSSLFLQMSMTVILLLMQ